MNLFQDLNHSPAGEALFAMSLAELQVIGNALDRFKASLASSSEEQMGISAAIQWLVTTYGQHREDGSSEFVSPQGYRYRTQGSDLSLTNLKTGLDIFKNGQVSTAASPTDRRFLQQLPHKVSYLRSCLRQWPALIQARPSTTLSPPTPTRLL